MNASQRGRAARGLSSAYCAPTGSFTPCGVSCREDRDRPSRAHHRLSAARRTSSWWRVVSIRRLPGWYGGPARWPSASTARRTGRSAGIRRICPSQWFLRIRTAVIIIIIRQPLCPVVGRRPQHAVSKLPCLVLSSAISCRSSICLGRLSTAWLVSIAVFSWSPSGDTRGPSVVFEAVDINAVYTRIITRDIRLHGD